MTAPKEEPEIKVADWAKPGYQLTELEPKPEIIASARASTQRGFDLGYYNNPDELWDSQAPYGTVGGIQDIPGWDKLGWQEQEILRFVGSGAQTVGELGRQTGVSEAIDAAIKNPILNPVVKFAGWGIGQVLGLFDLGAEVPERMSGLAKQVKLARDSGTLDEWTAKEYWNAWRAASRTYDVTGYAGTPWSGLDAVSANMPGPNELVRIRQALNEGAKREDIDSLLQQDMGVMYYRGMLADAAYHTVFDVSIVLGKLKLVDRAFKLAAKADSAVDIAVIANRTEELAIATKNLSVAEEALAEARMAEQAIEIGLGEARQTGRIAGQALLEGDLLAAETARSATRAAAMNAQRAFEDAYGKVTTIQSQIRELKGMHVATPAQQKMAQLLGSSRLDPLTDVARVSPEGFLNEGATLWKPWTWFRWRPETKVMELINRVGDHGAAIVYSLADPKQMIRVLTNPLAALEYPQLGTHIFSQHGRALRWTLQSAAGKLGQLDQAFDASADMRSILHAMSHVLGKEPAEVVQLIGKMPSQELAQTLARAMGALPAGVPDTSVARITGLLADPAAAGRFLDDAKDLYLTQRIPFDLNTFRLHAIQILEETVAEQAIRLYGVRSQQWFEKALTATKAAETLAFLRLNPAYPIRNLLNNEVTMYARGVWNAMSEEQIVRYWDRIGYAPHRLGEGFGAADEIAKGVKQDSARQMLTNAIKGEAGWLDKTADGFRNINLGKIDGGYWAQAMERMASRRAFTGGMLDWMAGAWKPGKGFDHIADFAAKKHGMVAASFSDQMFPRLEGAIRDAVSPKEIDEILTSDLVFSMDEALASSAKALGRSPEDLRRVIGNEAIEALKRDLGDAFKAGDRERAVTVLDNFEANVQGHLDRLTDEAYEALVDRAAARMKATGDPSELLWQLDEMQNEAYAFNEAHLKSLNDRVRLIDQMPEEARAKAWERFFAQNDRHFTRLEQRMLARREGLNRAALRYGVPINAESTRPLDDMLEATRSFYTQKSNIWKAYIAGERNQANYLKARDAIDAAYGKLIRSTVKAQVRMDKNLLNLVDATKPELSRAVRAWRSTVVDVREAYMNDIRTFYRKIEALSPANQKAQWDEFNTKRLWWMTEIHNVEREGYDMLRTGRPFGSNNPKLISDAAIEHFASRYSPQSGAKRLFQEGAGDFERRLADEMKKLKAEYPGAPDSFLRKAALRNIQSQDSTGAGVVQRMQDELGRRGATGTYNAQMMLLPVQNDAPRLAAKLPEAVGTIADNKSKADFLTAGAIGAESVEIRRVFNAELGRFYQGFSADDLLGQQSPLLYGRWGSIESADMDGLLADLEELGYSPILTEGLWDGARNPAYFVPGLRSVDAWSLGHKHGQEAVLLSGHGDLGMDGMVREVDWSGMRAMQEGDLGAIILRGADGKDANIHFPPLETKRPWVAEMEGPDDVIWLEVDVQSDRFGWPSYYLTGQQEINGELRSVTRNKVASWDEAPPDQSMILFSDGELRYETGWTHAQTYQAAARPDPADVNRMVAEVDDIRLYNGAQYHSQTVRVSPGYTAGRQGYPPTVIVTRSPTKKQWDVIYEIFAKEGGVTVLYEEPFGVANGSAWLRELKKGVTVRDPGKLGEIEQNLRLLNKANSTLADDLASIDPGDRMVGALSYWLHRDGLAPVPYRLRGTGAAVAPPGTTRLYTKVKRGDVYDLVEDADGIARGARLGGEVPHRALPDVPFFRGGDAADPNAVIGFRSQAPTRATFFQGGDATTSYTPGYHYREITGESQQLAQTLREAWLAAPGGRLTEDQAQTVVRLMDARAEVWARANPGKTKAQWYTERLYGVSTGLVDDVSLMQNMPKKEFADLLVENGLASPEMTLQLLGRNRPEYLDETVKFLVERRKRLASGQMNHRDVLRAWAMSVSSQKASPIQVQTALRAWEDAGIRIDLKSSWFVQEGKKWMIRPEDAMSAWMLTPNGRRFIDQLAGGGKVDKRLIDEFLGVRKPFGMTRAMETALSPKGGKIGMLNFAQSDFLERMNAIVPRLAEEGAQDEFLALMQELSYVGPSKDAFLSSMLGMGTRVTLDSNEIMYWLGAPGKSFKGTSSIELARWMADKSVYRNDQAIATWLRTGIQERFKGLRAAGVGADVPEEVYMEVMHHWLFDAVRGSETSHEAWYAAARLNQKPGQAVAKGAVTFLDDGKAVISALQKPDFSTAVHEFAHILRRHDLVGSDRQVVEKWLGVVDGKWEVAHEERFARAFELYLRNGVAPTPKLKSVFEKAKDWMRSIYKSVKGSELDVNMTDDVKRVFDRLFGSDVPDEPLGIPAGGLTRQQMAEMIPDEIPMAQGLDELWFSDGRNLMEPIRSSVLDQFDNPRPFKGAFSSLPEDQKGVVRSYIDHVKRQQADTINAGMRYAEAKRDASLLNYHHRTYFDHAVGQGLPFAFWTTHSAWNWFLWSWNKPWILASFYRYNKLRNEIPRTLPARFDGMVPLGEFPWLPRWMGTMFVNPIGGMLPFDLWAQPFETIEAKGVNIIQRTEREINRMAEQGLITQEEANAALAQRGGAAWDGAMQKVRDNSDPLDPLDSMQSLISPHAPIVWGWHVARGQPERIGPFLPITRTIKGLSALLGAPHGGINIEAPLRKALGLPAFDQWDEYRAERMVSNMAAMGEVDVSRALEAIATHQGDIWEEAVTRAGKEYGVSVLGSTFAVPLRAYPPGEERSRWLVEQLGKAYEAERNGKEGAVKAFFEQYPEVTARMAIGDTPEQKMRTFLTDEIWNAWNEMTSLEKRAVSDALGEPFQRSFLDKETRSSEIPINVLETWAAAIMSKQPGVYTDVQIKWPDQAMANVVQVFYDERQRIFGDGIWDVQSGYFKLGTPAERRSYLVEHPELKQYWDWRRDWLARNPTAAPYIEEDPSKLPKQSKAQLMAAQATEPNFTWQEWSRVVEPTTFRLVADALRDGVAPPEVVMESLTMTAAQYGTDPDSMYDNMADAYHAYYRGR